MDTITVMVDMADIVDTVDTTDIPMDTEGTVIMDGANRYFNFIPNKLPIQILKMKIVINNSQSTKKKTAVNLNCVQDP